MAEIRQNPARIQNEGPAGRLIRWLGRPRAVTVRLRPVWALALAAGLATVLLLPWGPNGGPTPGVAQGIANFVGHFPGARSVEVVGQRASQQ